MSGRFLAAKESAELEGSDARQGLMEYYVVLLAAGAEAAGTPASLLLSRLVGESSQARKTLHDVFQAAATVLLYIDDIEDAPSQAKRSRMLCTIPNWVIAAAVSKPAQRPREPVCMVAMADVSAGDAQHLAVRAEAVHGRLRADDGPRGRAVGASAAGAGTATVGVDMMMLECKQG